MPTPPGPDPDPPDQRVGGDGRRDDERDIFNIVINESGWDVRDGSDICNCTWR